MDQLISDLSKNINENDVKEAKENSILACSQEYSHLVMIAFDEMLEENKN